MLTESLAQLRFAASILFGLPFDVGSLERLVVALRETRREFGAIGAAGGELVGGPPLDDESRRMLQLRRFRHQARRAAGETAYYAPLFDRLALDSRKLEWDDLAQIPLTTKEALRADPDAFVRRSARPSWCCTTTGTTGTATTIYFSADEMRSFSALSAISLLMAGTVGEDDVVQVSTSARALLGNHCFMGACALVGAAVHPAGLVDPAHTLALLAEPRRIAGKKERVSVLMTYPSHLGELVEQGLAEGRRPKEFGLERIALGGELVSQGVKTRARRLFGDVEFHEGFGMTEIWPLGGSLCPEQHLHFEPTQGLIEVIDPATGDPTGSGQVGTIVATPFAPYRQTMPLLRYDTEDVVRVLEAAPTCQLRHLPATSNLLGKLRLSARHEQGWTFPRQVIEALEVVEDVPLPARCGFRAVPGGVAVEVIARADTPATRRAIERSLESHGVPIRALSILADRRQLRSPLPWRCDLREAVFSPGAEPRVNGSAAAHRVLDTDDAQATELLQDVVRRAFDGVGEPPVPSARRWRRCDVSNTAPLVVVALSFATISLGMVYFRRWQLTRPPIGVFNLGDVAFMMGGILVVPLLYLAVPTWVVIGLMALGSLSAIYVAAEPVLKSAWACWLLVAIVAGAEAWAALATEPASQWFFLVNNVAVIACVIGVANLWVQSGMKARDAAVLGGALAVYDLVATGILPLMGDLMTRTATMPFGPVVAWRDAPGGSWALIGMGDLLVSTMFPLVMRKAYGRVAGQFALLLSGAGISATFVLIVLGLTSLFPVMVVVGPLMVLQYLWWARRAEGERTTYAYLTAEPIR